jgi:hypothetical protein
LGKDWRFFGICEYLKMAGMSGSRPDAVLGTREFSRVRQFDMEERRKRILGNPKYNIAVLLSLSTTFSTYFLIPLLDS